MGVSHNEGRERGGRGAEREKRNILTHKVLQQVVSVCLCIFYTRADLLRFRCFSFYYRLSL